jgi:hypothetical protein
MIIDDSPGMPRVARDASTNGRRPVDRADLPLAVDRISRLRHDLRNSVNQVLGYGELLIEEANEGRRPIVADGLRSILALGKQVLALINDGLPGHGEGEGRDEAAIDLPALRLRLLEPLGRIIADCDELTREAPAPAQGGFRADVARIRAGASRLAEMADEMLAGPRSRGAIAGERPE